MPLLPFTVGISKLTIAGCHTRDFRWRESQVSIHIRSSITNMQLRYDVKHTEGYHPSRTTMSPLES